MSKIDPIHIELALRALQEGKEIRVQFMGSEQKLAMTEENHLYLPYFFTSDSGRTSMMGLPEMCFSAALQLLSTANIMDITQ